MSTARAHSIAAIVLLLATIVQADWRDLSIGTDVRIQIGHRSELIGTVSDVVEDGLYLEDSEDPTLWFVPWHQIESLSQRVDDEWRIVPSGAEGSPPTLRVGAQIRVRGIEFDAWVSGPLVRVDADSLVMVDDLVDERIAVALTPTLQAQIEVPRSTDEVRRRKAIRVGSAVGGYMTLVTLSCMQACNNTGEVVQTAVAAVLVTGVAALIGHSLPAGEGTTWRDVPLTPTVAISGGRQPMLTLRWR